ncbi:MAG: DUF4136 domain-containing protein [Bacteroidetes bacterium]|nr:DUF4136 domain-containing protein [Bacteroidota bacterium]MCX6306428.1 DUF4136 domain-containing protein [Bacteroidota bacterium]
MKTKLILLFLGAGLILASCTKYPPSSDRLLEDLAIYTKYDTTVNFAKFKKYYMNDSIVKISDKDSGMYYNAQVKSLTDEIAVNMKNLGYTRVTNSSDTSIDLFLAASYMVNVNVNVYYPGWYWGYYPPYYWGGSGYYPYYPAYITSYSVGTVLLDLINVNKEDMVGGKYPVCWNAYIRGLLTGSHTTAQINQSVDQAFKQTKGFPGH